MKKSFWNSTAFAHLVFLLFFNSVIANATLPDTSSTDYESFGKPSTFHYTIDESEKSQKYNFNPVHEIENIAEKMRMQIEQSFQLLQFLEHEGPMERPDEPYKREKHFGRWIRDPRTPKDCRNIRSKVLERDSLGPVQTTADGCVVTRGEWQDPYAGRTFTDSRDIQIDHFVPLKNAYISGGFRWSQQEKCLYANYMGNNFHLLAVDGTENNNKSDSTPENYMPPYKSYRCQYLSQWLKIKLIWSLALTDSEVAAIRRLVNENHCEPKDFSYSTVDLAAQRRFKQQNLDLCR